MVKAPNVPDSQDHNEESRDACDTAVEGHDMLSATKLIYQQGKDSEPQLQFSCFLPHFIFIYLEVPEILLRFSECKFCSYPRPKGELQTFPLSQSEP